MTAKDIIKSALMAYGAYKLFAQDGDEPVSEVVETETEHGFDIPEEPTLVKINGGDNQCFVKPMGDDMVEYVFAIKVDPKAYASQNYDDGVASDQGGEDDSDPDVDDEIAEPTDSATSMDAAPTSRQAMSDARKACAASLAQCKAKNKLACPYHGSQIVKMDLMDKLAKAGLQYVPEIALETDAKGKETGVYIVKIPCDAPAAARRSLEKVVDDFMKTPGILQESLGAGTKYDYMKDIDWDNQAKHKARKGYYSFFEVDALNPYAGSAANAHMNPQAASAPQTSNAQPSSPASAKNPKTASSTPAEQPQPAQTTPQTPASASQPTQPQQTASAPSKPQAAVNALTSLLSKVKGGASSAFGKLVSKRLGQQNQTSANTPAVSAAPAPSATATAAASVTTGSQNDQFGPFPSKKSSGAFPNAGTGPNDIDFSQFFSWSKAGSGSTEPRKVTINGETFFVKKAGVNSNYTDAAAENEVNANNFIRMAGFDAPESKLYKDASGTYAVSKSVQTKATLDGALGNKKVAENVTAAYPLMALMYNTDILENSDNAFVDGDTPIFLDNGSTFGFSAQGTRNSKKKFGFDYDTREEPSSSVNPTSGMLALAEYQSTGGSNWRRAFQTAHGGLSEKAVLKEAAKYDMERLVDEAASKGMIPKPAVKAVKEYARKLDLMANPYRAKKSSPSAQPSASTTTAQPSASTVASTPAASPSPAQPAKKPSRVAKASSAPVASASSNASQSIPTTPATAASSTPQTAPSQTAQTGSQTAQTGSGQPAQSAAKNPKRAAGIARLNKLMANTQNPALKQVYQAAIAKMSI